MPPDCIPHYQVALVIPFRDRDAHLRIFLQHMHPFLQRQFINYTIYVVEQVRVGVKYSHLAAVRVKSKPGESVGK